MADVRQGWAAPGGQRRLDCRHCRHLHLDLPRIRQPPAAGADLAKSSQAYLVTKGVCRDKTGKILGIYGISHDITELRRLVSGLRSPDKAVRDESSQALGQVRAFENIHVLIDATTPDPQHPDAPARLVLDQLADATIVADVAFGGQRSQPQRE